MAEKDCPPYKNCMKCWKKKRYREEKEVTSVWCQCSPCHRETRQSRHAKDRNEEPMPSSYNTRLRKCKGEASQQPLAKARVKHKPTDRPQRTVAKFTKPRKLQPQDDCPQPSTSGSEETEGENRPTVQLLDQFSTMMEDDAKLVGSCVSSSVLLSPNKMAVTDWRNSKVKLLDLNQQTIIAVLKTPSDPWDLTLVAENMLAATLPHTQMILFVAVTNNLQIERQFPVEGKCRGITHTGGNLIVTFEEPRKIEVMSLNGTVERRIQRDGVQLFQWPLYVATSPDCQNIFVSDFLGSLVRKFDQQGEVLAEFTGQPAVLRYSSALAMDGMGRLFLCGELSHNIFLLDSDCKLIAVLIEHVPSPMSLSYCEHTGRLYVGLTTGEVQVYKVH